MEVQISPLEDGERSEDSLRSLRDWLMEETPRPGAIELVGPPAAPGAMGPVADTVQVALGTGGALAVLAQSVSTWLRTRRGRVKLHIRRADGGEILIDAETADPEGAIAAFLESATEDG